MLRWHLQQGRSMIPKSTNPQRITENIDVFDFDLSTGELAVIDALSAQRNIGDFAPKLASLTDDVYSATSGYAPNCPNEIAAGSPSQR